jgi:hypothetical protein
MSRTVLGFTGDAEARSRRLEEAICQIIEQYLPDEEKKVIAGDQGFDPRKVPLVSGHNCDAGSTCHT